MMPETAPAVVIAAPATLELATRLAETLRMRGWTVAHATSAEEVGALAAGQPCVVVVSPATRDELVCARAAIERRFSRRIPVFAMPMALPGGTWTAAPIPPQPSVDHLTDLVILAITAPLAAKTPDPKDDQRRARMLWWQSNMRQIQVLVIILAIILVFGLCRLAILFGLAEAIFHFGG